ncbi:MAG: DUF2889 domain-containing protein [Spongiibacteraceae bacterium]
MSAAVPLEQLPGFRRRFRITPGNGKVQTEVEDDYHCMSVIVHHDGAVATAVEPEMRRVPWSTCPGAVEQLKSTFIGAALKDFPIRGEKKINCTHLHDLATLAAEHAFDSAPTIYDILVSDPIEGQRRAELRKDGKTVLAWSEASFQLTAPAEVAGLGLMNMRAWIDTLDPEMRKAAKLLQWGNMIANGRAIPLAQQSDATKMPPNCFTFQPERAVIAKRVGEIRDFSAGSAKPLDQYSVDGR